ncbi:hypothetical protein PLESTM_001549500 [Pleodorina starrii]|nr:hypothetical protein PLESTM_001549500 [Pleodorina starrii]
MWSRTYSPSGHRDAYRISDYYRYGVSMFVKSFHHRVDATYSRQVLTVESCCLSEPSLITHWPICCSTIPPTTTTTPPPPHRRRHHHPKTATAAPLTATQGCPFGG